ncbi:MAG: hypothetical protein QXI33_00300 [Candidatus Pacearchaeota archaeon]
MIKNMEPITLAEAKKLVEENEGREDIKGYFKKFLKLNEKESIEMKKEIENLNNHKIRKENIVKIIDFLPIDASDINKIFTDVSLEENEIKQITDIVAKYR